MERGKFTECDAVEVIKTVLEAVKYLHEHNVVHRGEPNIRHHLFDRIFCFYLHYLNIICRFETGKSTLQR